MDHCCSSARRPQVHLVGERPEPPQTPESAKLLDDGALCSLPLSPLGDLKLQISDLQQRQEELFKLLIDQQSGLQSQLLAVYASSGNIEQRQETLITEFREYSSRPLGECASREATNELVSNADTIVIKKSPLGSSCSLQSPTENRAENSEALAKTVSLSSPSSEKRPSAKNRKSKMRESMVMKFTMQPEEEDPSPRGRIEKLLHSKEFEFAIAGAIMVNALIISWECQYAGLELGFKLQFPGRRVQAHIAWQGADTVFLIFDLFFGILFLCELSVKLAIWRCRYFYDSTGWESQEWEVDWLLRYRRCVWSIEGWNILDFICVLAFLIEKVGEVGSLNPQMLRLLRLGRLFRMIRLLRDLESLDHLYVMATAITHLSRVLFWAIIFLSIMLLACNLFLVGILHATYFNVTASQLSREQLKKHHEMYEYFGTCTRCMLSMFEITLGDWPPIARLLSEEVSEWFTLVCLLHKLTIGFAVIGVITGVILQETFKVAQTDDVIMLRNKKQASATLRKKMKTLFLALDQDGDGRIDESEFTTIGNFPEIECWLASLEIETDDLNTLFSLIDENSNGYVTLDELVGRMPRIKGSARGIDMLAMRNKLQI